MTSKLQFSAHAAAVMGHSSTIFYQCCPVPRAVTPTLVYIEVMNHEHLMQDPLRSMNLHFHCEPAISVHYPRLWTWQFAALSLN